MKIGCQFAKDSYAAGGTVVVLLRCSDSCSSVGKIEAQVHGHASIDKRWNGSTASISRSFSQAFQYPVEANIKIPKIATPRDSLSFCVYLTPKVTIPTTCLNGEQYFLQFDVPFDSLPSYRGLCAQVFYALSVSYTDHYGETHQLNFPFVVKGTGSNITPFSVRCGTLVVSPGNCAAEKIFNISDAGVDIINEENGTVEDVTYSITDQYPICVVQLISPAIRTVATWFPGSNVMIRIDFTDGVQPCRSVNTRLILCENHPSGSRIQEKILASSCRSTADAMVVKFLFQIPSDAPCEFTSPLFSISFKIEMDFNLSVVGEPLTWSTPIRVVLRDFDSAVLSDTAECKYPVMTQHQRIMA